MLLQTVRPNIVQSIRAYRVEDLMHAAQAAGQHFLYAEPDAGPVQAGGAGQASPTRSVPEPTSARTWTRCTTA